MFVSYRPLDLTAWKWRARFSLLLMFKMWCLFSCLYMGAIPPALRTRHCYVYDSDYEICFRSCFQLACSIQKYMVFIRFRIKISLVIFNTYIPVYKQLIVRRNFVADAILIRKIFLKDFGVNLITTTILTDVNTDCAQNRDGVLKW